MATTTASTPELRNRALGAFLGLAIGDALGTTLEFTARDTKPALTDMVGGGVFRLKPGQWTDDTSMALCLADSLIASRADFDPTDLMQRFLRWYRRGENSVTGRCFDIGNATRDALELFERTGRTAASYEPDPSSAGNGSLMRLAPVAIAASTDIGKAVRLADEQSRTTHRALLAHDACRFFATILVEALNGAERDAVLRPRGSLGSLGPLAGGAWRQKDRSQISSSGYVLSTLEASLWCVGYTGSFEEAVLLAANLGDDADTVAAVTGQLAGALYGQSGIPPYWLERLAWRQRIEARTDELLALAVPRDDTATPSLDPHLRELPDDVERAPAWVRKVRSGDLDALPATFRWETSNEVASMINGYDLMPFETLAGLAGRVLAEVRSDRNADIAPLDLWATLFFQHRAYRHNCGEAQGDELQLLDRLCRDLREAVLRQDREGRAALLNAMRTSSNAKRLI